MKTFLAILIIPVFYLGCAFCQTAKSSPAQIEINEIETTQDYSNQQLPACSWNALSFGIGYPYGAIKYGCYNIGLELKGAFGSGIKLYAARFYYYLFNHPPVRFFIGGEGGYIDFDDVYDISGKGWQVSGFAGAEAFILNWLSTSVDFAATHIALESGSKEERGLEYVISTAIYIYPF